MERDMMQREIENFAHNVAWLRKHYGISKKKMAELLWIGIWSLNKIEKGEIPTRLSVEILFDIHKCFGACPAAQFSRRLGESL